MEDEKEFARHYMEDMLIKLSDKNTEKALRCLVDFKNKMKEAGHSKEDIDDFSFKLLTFLFIKFYSLDGIFE